VGIMRLRFPTNFGRQGSRLRRAAASLEVVMVTGVSFPAAVILYYLAMRACRGLYHVMGNWVGSPYM
jgi:hypothetical protein